MRTSRWIAVLVVVALTIVLASAAGADVLKNKKTGETIKGTLTQQRVNGRNIFKDEFGGTKFIDLSEWEIVERSAPATLAPKPATGGAATTAGASAPGPVDTCPIPVEKRAYIIPISGPIMEPCLVEGMEKAIDEARTYKAAYVIFRLNTPGGRIDIGERVIDLIDKIDWAKTVAWVEGDKKQALSCGAYISLATHKIYMCPGSTIGAATPFRVSMFGSAEVEEKMTSAFRARFRSLAQQKGHPSAIADAMVDNTVSVVEVFMDGQRDFVSMEEATRLERANKGTDHFKRGKTVCMPGKILTLTSDEAVGFELAAGVAKDREELAAALGIDAEGVKDAEWLVGWAEKEGAKRKDEIEKHVNAFRQSLHKAFLSDPHQQQYAYRDSYGTFTDNGAKWQAYTSQCLGYLKECARALMAIEKLAKDPKYDLEIPQELIDEWKVEMNGFYNRVQSESGARRLPM